MKKENRLEVNTVGELVELCSVMSVYELQRKYKLERGYMMGENDQRLLRECGGWNGSLIVSEGDLAKLLDEKWTKRTSRWGTDRGFIGIRTLPQVISLLDKEAAAKLKRKIVEHEADRKVVTDRNVRNNLRGQARRLKGELERWEVSALEAWGQPKSMDEAAIEDSE